MITRHLQHSRDHSWSMKCGFTLLLLFLRFYAAKTASEKEKIAVCVTGLATKWFPEQHLKNLVGNNPQYHFAFFFSFETHNKYSQRVGYPAESDPISKITKDTLTASIHQMTSSYSTPNSELANLRFIMPYSNASWYKHLRLTSNQPFNRVTSLEQSGAGDVSLLNYYRLQQSCVYDIMAKEKERHDRKLEAYDYVIFTREDLIYFQPLNITLALHKLRREAEDSTDAGTQKCNIITKGCLEGRGVNMKMQVMRRKEGLHLVASRLRFYRSLFEKNLKVDNPEILEFLQLEMMNYHKCTLPVDTMGVASARPTDEYLGFCFPESELQDLDTHDICAPTHFFEALKKMGCSNFNLLDPDEVAPLQALFHNSKYFKDAKSGSADADKGPSEENLRLSKAVSSWESGIKEGVDRSVADIMLHAVKRFFRKRNDSIEAPPTVCP